MTVPTWSDKLVAEVVHLLLEAYYDVQFSDRSHGFRPGRGCHTALSEVAAVWTGTHWFIEGDISDCFGSLDHTILVGILAEKIHDGRFLGLITRMLQAGYLEDWKWNATLSGAPQGGTASPILSNIYLDRLDRFVEQHLLPQYNQGSVRRKNPAYLANKSQIEKAERRGNREAVRLLKQQRRRLPSGDPNDPGFRRLRYVRYCDDWLLGFAGPKHEAEQIKTRIRQFLREDLKLELSEAKTLITHATSQAARFLGYEIRTQHANTKITRGRRGVNGIVALHVPNTVIRQRCARYRKHGKPATRGQLLHDTDYTIVEKYGAEYRGFVQYYLLAQDVYRLSTLHWVMQTSLLKTLAAKHRSSVTTMARAHKATIDTPDGPRICLQAIVHRDAGRKPLVARFGGIPLVPQRTAVLTDRQPIMASPYNELVHRLLAGQCELRRASDGLQVHHIRRLADLNRPGRPDRPPDADARPWWSARPAITTSMQDAAQHSPGNDHWRAVCGQSRPHGSGRGRRKRTHTMGTSPAAYFTLNVHVSAAMRELIAARDWLHVIRLPAYAPDLNPTEAVWSHLKRSIGNLAVNGVAHLQAIIKNRLKRIQYRTDLLDSFLAHTGLTLEPDST